MAPRPSSHREPSSQRAISKSPKTTELGGASSITDLSRAARRRQARHSPLLFNGSPHTEQLATTEDTDIAMPHLHQRLVNARSNSCNSSSTSASVSTVFRT